MIAQGNVKLSLIWSYMFNNRLLLALEACISVFEGIAGNVLVYARVRVKENKGEKCERDEKMSVYMYVCAPLVFALQTIIHFMQRNLTKDSLCGKTSTLGYVSLYYWILNQVSLAQLTQQSQKPHTNEKKLCVSSFKVSVKSKLAQEMGSKHLGA